MAKKSQAAPKNFEEALAELEQILAGIEGGQISLEDSLTKYQRGNYLIQYCQGILARAEKQIEQISKAPDGSLVAEPLNDEPESSK